MGNVDQDVRDLYDPQIADLHAKDAALQSEVDALEARVAVLEVEPEPPLPALVAPPNLTMQEEADGVVFAWQPVPTATSYQWQRRTSGGTSISAGNVTLLVIKLPIASGEEFRVRAERSGEVGPWASAIWVDEAPVPPPSGNNAIPTPAGWTRQVDWTMEDTAHRPGNGPQTYVNVNGTHVARYTWPAGFQAGQSIGYFNTGFGPGVTVPWVLLRYTFQLSPNFTPAPSLSKHLYFRSQYGNSTYLGWKSNGSFELDTQGIPGQGSANHSMGGNVPIGQKARIEILIRGDGSAVFAVNGAVTKTLSPGTLWPVGAALRFDRVNFDSVWGGTGATVPATQHMDYDNIEIWKP